MQINERSEPGQTTDHQAEVRIFCPSELTLVQTCLCLPPPPPHPPPHTHPHPPTWTEPPLSSLCSVSVDKKEREVRVCKSMAIPWSPRFFMRSCRQPAHQCRQTRRPSAGETEQRPIAYPKPDQHPVWNVSVSVLASPRPSAHSSRVKTGTVEHTHRNT